MIEERAAERYEKEQAEYEAKMAVDMDSYIIVAGHISQATNDKRQLVPFLDFLETLPDELGEPERIAADNGYYS